MRLGLLVSVGLVFGWEALLTALADYHAVEGCEAVIFDYEVCV